MMPSLERIIAELVDNAGLTSADHSVEGLFSALFHGLSGGGTAGTGIGGLPGLISRFAHAGLGDIIHSWIGDGPNLPITPDQLRAALGPHAVKAICAASAREEHDLLGELAQLLPGVVDRVTHAQKS
jgi:uncharacterized protein YidB (DUF937 family)